MASLHRKVHFQLNFPFQIIGEWEIGKAAHISAKLMETGQIVGGNLAGGKACAHATLEVTGSSGPLGQSTDTNQCA